jgi:hypothetical protein
MDKLFEYKIENGKVCITKYVGSSKDVVIPEEIDGYEVTSKFSETKFRNLEENLKDSLVTSIGHSAFRNNKLTSVNLSGVISIGNHAFRYNELTSVDLSGIESIGDFAFDNNKLTSVDLTGVKSIGKNAFYNNKFEAILLPIKFRKRTKSIFNFDEKELDNRNKKFIKKYVNKMRKLYIKKLYKNSRKYGLIFEYITYYTYRESYNRMLKEAIKNCLQ